ncbi:MAG: dTDP-4-dehydrorhamnose 3,5-epimerase [Succinivibrio sp.]|nr:dTDP-4-dehydrorhamnose 3,5-epimerase [Succinivibrio sp.]
MIREMAAPAHFGFSSLKVQGAVLIEPLRHEDSRGQVAELYRRSEFEAQGLCCDFAQATCSVSRLGTLRGLHLQRAPYAQIKLLRCVKGAVLDVIADVRKDSPTYLSHEKVLLSAENHLELYVPAGVAHGFVALEDNSEVAYLTSGEYVPEAACSIRFDDIRLNIDWELEQRLSGVRLLLSDKDEQALSLDEFEALSRGV